jgi:hypothetical protein
VAAIRSTSRLLVDVSGRFTTLAARQSHQACHKCILQILQPSLQRLAFLLRDYLGLNERLVCSAKVLLNGLPWNGHRFAETEYPMACQVHWHLGL